MHCLFANWNLCSLVEEFGKLSHWKHDDHRDCQIHYNVTNGNAGARMLQMVPVFVLEVFSLWNKTETLRGTKSRIQNML